MPRLTPGTYTVTVQRAFLTESSKGTLGIAFNFTCPDGTIDHVIWVTPASSERALETLDALGFGQEQLSEVENLDRIEEFTKGNECSIMVEDEEYNGNVTAKVKWINKVGARKISNPLGKAALFALLKGQTPPPRTVSGPRTQTASRATQAATEPPPNTPFDDTNVPF